MIKRLLIPKDFVNSIYEINKVWLQERQLESLIVDLDNTLLGRAENQPDERLKAWVQNLQADGVKLIVLSNNWSPRVKKIADALGLKVIAPAYKPFTKAFRQALKKINAQAAKTAVVGDQLFTDIIGGNWLKLYTVLVPPASDVDLIHTKILRVVEKFILKFGAKVVLNNGKWFRVRP